MSGTEKAEVLTKVASSGLPKRRALGELGVPRSTYYRWLRRKEQQGLEDDIGASTPPWNKLASQEIDSVLTAAREMPELSCRQLAAWTTDNMGFSVSESTVYRILRREGLVKRPEMQLAAGKEYHRKTTGPHQMWATDASYFRVVGWGYYYMVTVMDDYSRFILAHRLQRDMTSDSFIEVVQEAVDRTGMDQIPIEDRTRLLSLCVHRRRLFYLFLFGTSLAPLSEVLYLIQGADPISNLSGFSTPSVVPLSLTAYTRICG